MTPLFEESCISGMGYNRILHVALTSSFFNISNVITGRHIAHISLEKLRNAEVTTGFFFPELIISYFDDKDYFHTFSITTRKSKEWGKALESAGVHVTWPED